MPETEAKMKQAYNMYRNRIGKGSSAMTYKQFKKNYEKTRAKTENMKKGKKKYQSMRTEDTKSGMKSRYGVDWKKDRPSARLKRRKK